MRNKILARLGALALCLAMCMSLSVTAFASTTGPDTPAFDRGRRCSLTMTYGPERDRLEGATFNIYKVADIADDFYLSLSGDFSRANVVINGLDAKGWSRAAETLASYVDYRKIQPTKAGETTAAGQVTFNDLPIGVYLIVAENIERDDVIYESIPCLYAVPYLEKNSWNYNPSAVMKYVTYLKDLTSIRVIKGWNDAGFEEKRPDSVHIALTKDGDIIDTVELNKANNWRYTWDHLDGGYTYRAFETEDPSANYTVTVNRTGNTFVIVNRYDDPSVPVTPPTPITPTTPTPSNPDVPPVDIPDDSVPQAPYVKPTTPTTPVTPIETIDIPDEKTPLEDLPKTGQLWWPVPLLCCAGGFCILMAVRKKGEADSDSDE